MRYPGLLLMTTLAFAAPFAESLPEGPAREKCQSYTQNPLEGCPEGTVLVSSTSSAAHHKTIQGAIDSLPDDDSAHTILILSGSYTEQLNITRPGPVTLLGQTSYCTDATRNEVTVYQALANSASKYTDNVYASVMIVAPTLNASFTGAGPTGWPIPEGTPFGCKDFRTYNIDFRNVFSDVAVGPSHAISFSYSNGGFYYSGFYSLQDTVYIGKNGSAYFYGSIIAGQTDFLYGFGTAWLQNCDIRLRGCGGGITAWKGTNTTFPNHYGVYIADSTVSAANDSIAATIKSKCALGRPWNSNHRSIFARTYEDGSIRPFGYIPWSSSITNDTLMAEYKTYGPGFNQTGRAEGNITTILSDEEFSPYSTPGKVFGSRTGEFGNTGWIDEAYHPY